MLDVALLDSMHVVRYTVCMSSTWQMPMNDSAPAVSNEALVPSPSPSRQFTIQWAAGFVDGEGCIHIAKQRYRAHRSPTYRLGMHVTQNDLATLEHFRDGLGIDAPIYKVKRAANHRRQCYTLNYSGTSAMQVISLLTPHLVRKRREADAAQAFWHEGRIGERPGPKGWEPEVVEKRESYFLMLKQLK